MGIQLNSGAIPVAVSLFKLFQSSSLFLIKREGAKKRGKPEDLPDHIFNN